MPTSADGPSPVPTPAPATRSQSRPTSARATNSTDPSPTFPSATPTRTKRTTRPSPPRFVPAGWKQPTPLRPAVPLAAHGRAGASLDSSAQRFAPEVTFSCSRLHRGVAEVLRVVGVRAAPGDAGQRLQAEQPGGVLGAESGPPSLVRAVLRPRRARRTKPARTSRSCRPSGQFAACRSCATLVVWIWRCRPRSLFRRRNLAGGSPVHPGQAVSTSTPRTAAPNSPGTSPNRRRFQRASGRCCFRGSDNG